MLQYLINATAIWLLSLLLFDLLLRGERFHAYNRFYLLFTLLLGAIFPLVEWGDREPFYSDTNSVQSVIKAKKGIVTAATAGSNATSLENWLRGIYLAGVAISCLLLITEIVKLVKLYRNGRVSRAGVFKVIETGSAHAPFSLLNLLFVNSKAQYSSEEWQIVVAHEQRHKELYHFADLLLLQCIRIVAWFHPLSYLYNKNLLMVHEYQADSIATQAPHEYGQFLLEQSALASAPALSHSFNRSPIKKRIIMLTKKSSRAARIKTFVFIPLMAACVICFAQNGLSHKKERKGDMVTFMGNKFELSKAMPQDTVITENPITGEAEMKVTRIEQYPVKMNGEQIYYIEEVNVQPGLLVKESTLIAYLKNQLQDELSQLPDGNYSLIISNIVTSASGHIVYYDFDGISPQYNGTASRIMPIDKELERTINEKTERLLDKISISPAKYKGKKVHCLTNGGKVFNSYSAIEVKDHKVSGGDK